MNLFDIHGGCSCIILTATDISSSENRFFSKSIYIKRRTPLKLKGRSLDSWIHVMLRH